MRLLLIEKDNASLDELEQLATEIIPEKTIAGRCMRVQETEEWLTQHDAPDLILAAVQLDDGLIFPALSNNIPVVYIAAVSEFAVEAFRTNAVDYLLKPVGREALQAAVQKYERIYTRLRRHPVQRNGAGRFQERFIVTVGQQMKLVHADDIAYFYTENKVVYMMTFDGTKYTTDFTLGRLEQLLNPARFFRINRQFIISLPSVVKMKTASKARLHLTLRPETRHDAITSFERTPDFKRWLVGML